MPRILKKVSKMAGLPPGTLVHIGDKKVEKSIITLFDYEPDKFEEKQIKRIDECFPFRDKASITWINVDGLEEVHIIEQLDSHFGIHPLVLEDILNTSQGPKFEDYDDYTFAVVKSFSYDEKTQEIIAEQISLILGKNYVISFQEKPGDAFDPIRDRIRNLKGRVRKMGADYLCYALIDAIVDSYYITLEKLAEKIEILEDRVETERGVQIIHDLHRLKGQIIFLRKQIWPLREVISGFQRSESKLITKPIAIYFRDLYDHAIQVIDAVESFRDILSSIQDIHLSLNSNRMNEVMKILTIFSAVFIPLNFLAGVYGMNFKIMPELEWQWGYYVVLAIMASVAIVLLFYFKRKKWL